MMRQPSPSIVCAAMAEPALNSAPDVLSLLHVGGRGKGRTATARAVEAVIQRGMVAFPEIGPLPPAAIARALGAAGVNLDGERTTAHPGELWLAAGCVAQSRQALATLDREYVRKAGRGLSRLGLNAVAIDDVLQRVRERLLGLDGHGELRLAGYAGRGRLLGLVRVMAVRIALDDRRKAERRAARWGDRVDDVELVMEGALGPELRCIRQECSVALKEALETAIAQLDPKSRLVLRLHLLERASIDEIAALYSVHRSTAARWLVSARAKVSDAHDGVPASLLRTRRRCGSQRVEHRRVGTRPQPVSGAGRDAARRVAESGLSQHAYHRNRGRRALVASDHVASASVVGSEPWCPVYRHGDDKLSARVGRDSASIRHRRPRRSSPERRSRSRRSASRCV